MVYGFKILCEISKGTFEISHKILNPPIAKYVFYCLVFLRVSYNILNCVVISLNETDLWAVVFQVESFELLMPSQWRAIMEITNIIS